MNEAAQNSHGQNSHGQHALDDHPLDADRLDAHRQDDQPDEGAPHEQWLDEPGSDEQGRNRRGPDAPNRDELLLGRLRQWLADARASAEELGERPSDLDAPQPAPGDSEFGLVTLVEEFTALRHELKLQTKTMRGQEEESQAQLAGLRLAIEAFRSVEPKEALAVWSAGKGLATALADLDEALERGRTQIERAGRVLIDEPARALPVALDKLYSRQSWFRRLLWRSYHRQARALAATHGRNEREALFAALFEGYGLIQGRLTRALAAQRVERMATLGKPVDPERMIVIEVVEATDKPPGAVVEEVRRGYTWNDRVLRCAEVRAAREHPGWVLAGAHESSGPPVEASNEKTSGERAETSRRAEAPPAPGLIGSPEEGRRAVERKLNG
jgi:molecular chaperone GrpE